MLSNRHLQKLYFFIEKPNNVLARSNGRARSIAVLVRIQTSGSWTYYILQVHNSESSFNLRPKLGRHREKRCICCTLSPASGRGTAWLHILALQCISRPHPQLVLVTFSERSTRVRFECRTLSVAAAAARCPCGYAIIDCKSTSLHGYETISRTPIRVYTT